MCMVLQAVAVAGRHAGACGCCFLTHLPRPSPSRLLLGKGSPRPSTRDEGAKCQPAGGSAGAADGAQSLLLQGRLVAGSKGTCAWGLRTISFKTPLVLG